MEMEEPARKPAMSATHHQQGVYSQINTLVVASWSVCWLCIQQQELGGFSGSRQNRLIYETDCLLKEPWPKTKQVWFVNAFKWPWQSLIITLPIKLDRAWEVLQRRTKVLVYRSHRSTWAGLNGSLKKIWGRNRCWRVSILGLTVWILVIVMLICAV